MPVITSGDCCSTMKRCQKSCFLFYSLLCYASALILETEHDWTFGERRLNLAYNKIASDDQAVDGDFETLVNIANNWWKVNLGGLFTVSMIRLYPERPNGGLHETSSSLEKVSILMSTIHDPGEISRDSDDWEEISFNTVVYGYGITVDFQRPVLMWNIGVKTFEATLKFAELQAFAPSNLASVGSLKASSGSVFYPLYLVDGNYGSNFQLQENGKKWIDIDLLEIFSIRIVEAVQCSDRDAKLLITKNNPIESLSQSENEWISKPSSRVGENGELQFEVAFTLFEARRVALISYQNSLTLAELVVHEYNYALSGLAEQTSTTKEYLDGEFLTYSANNAIDGSLDTFSETSLGNEPTWSVDFRKRIFFKRALVFIRNGLCGSVCCSRKFHGKSIVARTTREEKICFSTDNSVGDSIIVECEVAIFQKLIIISNQSEIGLREVVIHGNEIPAMSATELLIMSINETTISLTFHQWTSESPGSKPPDKYILRNNGSGQLEQTNFEHDGGNPIQTFLKALQWNDVISVYVECTVDREKCEGLPAGRPLYHHHMPTTTSKPAVVTSYSNSRATTSEPEIGTTKNVPRATTSTPVKSTTIAHGTSRAAATIPVQSLVQQQLLVWMTSTMGFLVQP